MTFEDMVQSAVSRGVSEALARLTPPELATYQELPYPEERLRHWQRAEPGFRACLVRIGSRLLVDVGMFRTWIDAHRVEEPQDVEPEPVVTEGPISPESWERARMA